MKACPYCAEQIQDAAIKCRHCGSDLSKATTVPPTPQVKPCPACAEEIPAASTVCPLCKSDLGAEVVPAGAERRRAVPDPVHAAASPAAARSPAPYWTPGRVALAVVGSGALLVGVPMIALMSLGGAGLLLDLGGGSGGGGGTYQTPTAAPMAAPAPAPARPAPKPMPNFIAGQPTFIDCSGLFDACLKVSCPLTNTGKVAGTAHVTATLVKTSGEQSKKEDWVAIIPNENRTLTFEFKGDSLSGAVAFCEAEYDGSEDEGE